MEKDINGKNIYCTYDTLNPTIERETGKEKHCCKNYGTNFCIYCESRYDGDKIKKYMEDNPIEHKDCDKEFNFTVDESQIKGGKGHPIKFPKTQAKYNIEKVLLDKKEKIKND